MPSLLVYNAREKKVYSINAEPRAPKLATIEWYQKNNGGKIPESDGLLSGGLPGVVDAWYTLLDRWGTMSFAQVLQPAIDLAENGFPLSEYGASYIAEEKKILKYPTTVKIYLPNGHPPKAGEILKNPDLARTLKKLVEAEKENQAKGRHEALKAARDRFYKGDIAKDLAAFSEANGGLFRYEDFADLLSGSRDAGFDQLPRLPDLQESVRQPGTNRTHRAQSSRRLRPEIAGPQQP